MTDLAPGDPASVSALAGELTRQGEALRERRVTLTRVEAHLSDWAGLAAEGFRTAFRTQARALDDCAEALTTAGHALQDYAVDLQHARARATEAQDYCERHGLRLEPDATVSLPWGQYSLVEAAQRQERLPEGQRLARVAAEEAQEAAHRLSRRVDGPVQALAASGQAALVAAGVATAAAQARPGG